MCGIAGFISRQPELSMRIGRQLNEAQRHRGPDDAVEVQVGSSTIGNTRLAIQEPTPDGNQPFESRDGRFVCVFNGEIYNYLELIRDHNLSPESRCDGAVIPELWVRLGERCLSTFRGMYALAVFDRSTGCTTLARDPFGIKPLYVRRLDEGLAFASEVRPLAALQHPPRLRPEAVARYLHLGSLGGDESPFEGIEAVPSNSWVSVDPDAQCTPYSRILSHEHPLVDMSTVHADGVGAAFRESVDLHLRSDVPTALLLSGGVDSAAVASVSRDLGRKLNCVTVSGFEALDESSDAAATAAHYGHAHDVVPARVDTATIDDFFKSMQRPTIDGLNTFLVSQAIREAGYKVALSGLGGDEALGGYQQ